MSEKRLPKKITMGDKYDPAMTISEQEEADGYFELLVQHGMLFGKTREQAEADERTSLGYYAGYYDRETRIRVENLFRCRHPVFGLAADGVPTPEEAFEAGVQMAKSAQPNQ